MHFDVTSAVTLAIMVVLVIIAIGSVLALIWRLLSPVIAQNKSLWRALRSFNWRMRYSRRRSQSRSQSHDGDESDDDDELDSTTIRVLSTLDAATIVVDSDDEVQRASSATYRWGLVKNDEIVNEEILHAINVVRRGEGRQCFDIVTSTDPDFIAGALEDEDTSEVATRPYWLSVVVRSISESLILVLVTDNSEAKRFAQTRDAFVTNVAEQLLEPTRRMEIIGGRLETTAHEGEVRSDGHIIAAHARHLNKLVADLLLLIRAQEKVVPSPDNRLNLGDIARSVCHKEQERAQRGVIISMRVADNIEVNASAEQLEAAIQKLVANALKYSLDNGTVTVVVSRSRDEKFGVVRVIDTGLGISKEDQKHIFERFYRGSTASLDNDEDSVGLGLAIVKHVALTHHGTVTVWSAPSQGSTFSLFIPLATK
ncbi:sensor histidine kinase [Alloscardovia venturai]|uniref:Sensor-like histidine kinase SenX3 n=1 Tax=Alloscardovia venturai TaxID=1769421 RepID=A0ABW2YA60_9BIFI